MTSVCSINQEKSVETHTRASGDLWINVLYRLMVICMPGVSEVAELSSRV
jgi:hypothetical protein